MVKLFLVISALLLWSCNPCRKPDVTDYGSLTEQSLIKIPYEDGQTYRFRHSGGKVIDFTCERSLKKVVDMDSEWFSCWEYHFEEDYTSLTPNYSIRGFSVMLSNRNAEEVLSISVGYSSFEISQAYSNEHVNKIDTLRINNILYNNVFEFENSWCDDTKEFENCVAKLYYNFDYGILKVVQNFNEYYEILQD